MRDGCEQEGSRRTRYGLKDLEDYRLLGVYVDVHKIGMWKKHYFCRWSSVIANWGGGAGTFTLRIEFVSYNIPGRKHASLLTTTEEENKGKK